MLKINSALTAAQESIVRETLSSGIEVHRNLGPGYKEPIYGTAFCLELESRGMKFEREKEHPGPEDRPDCGRAHYCGVKGRLQAKGDPSPAGAVLSQVHRVARRTRDELQYCHVEEWPDAGRTSARREVFAV